MSGFTYKFSTLALVALVIGLAAALPAPQQPEGPHNLLDIETPQSFSYSSPLSQPGSLSSRPYFDFLSTLYSHDSSKSNLFRPYSRTRRDVEVEAAAAPATHRRPRRAIVFRPLFVYKQQEVRKEEVRARRRSGRV